jgi:hypothetical protein
LGQLTATGASAAAVAGLNPLSWIVAGFGTFGASAVIAVATPFLAILSGPVATAAMAVAVAQVPLAWRRSVLKHKDHLPLAARDFITDAFLQLRTERVRELRKAGEILLREYRLKVEKQITETQTTLVAIRERRPSELQITALTDTQGELQRLMKALPPAGKEDQGPQA